MTFKPNVIARLRVKNYRGISFLDTAAIFPDGMPSKGMVIKGPNASGKTSVVNAILAALAAQDIKEDAIRIDEDRAEIMVEMTTLSATRTITPTQSKLVVKDDSGKPVKSPTDWLSSVLGTSLDPLAFAAKKPKERKAYILSALPLVVRPEQVTEWLEGWTLREPEALDYSLHGLEVVDAIRKDFTDRRAVKNAESKELAKEEEALIAGAPGAPADAPTIADADARAEAASQQLADLEGRQRRVHEHETRTASTRERAAKLRTEATMTRETAPVPDEAAEERLKQERAEHATKRATQTEDYERLVTALKEIEAKLQALGAEMQATESADKSAADQLGNIAEVRTDRQRALENADRMSKQADELEAAIQATAETEPTAEERASAVAALEAARRVQEDARALAHRREHEAKIAIVSTKRAAAEEEASKLDAMVTKFAKEIPAKLLEASNGIPGLTVDGDEVYLDGVRFSKLSGKEQILFAVRLARRLNQRAKVLIVDGLERVDSDVLPEFIAEATSDGYQLIATRVTNGDVEFEAIGEGGSHG